MKASSIEQIKERKKEIIQAVNKMFDEMDYQSISMKTISERISIARSSLYCYYNSKEEIMLDILQNDYINFLNDLIKAILNHNDLAKNITDIYLNNIRLLKIISVHLTDIETHVSTESLIAFKSPFVKLFNDLNSAFIKSFPNTPSEDIKTITNALLMLTHGLYPMIHPTENQIKAMNEVKMNYCTDSYSYCLSYLNLIFSKLK